MLALIACAEPEESPYQAYNVSLFAKGPGCKTVTHRDQILMSHPSLTGSSANPPTRSSLFFVPVARGPAIPGQPTTTPLVPSLLRQPRPNSYHRTEAEIHSAGQSLTPLLVSVEG